MSILTLAEAALIDPTVDQGRLDGIETMIRSRSANHFHLGHGVGPVTIAPGDDKALIVTVPLSDGAPALVEGDTAELTGCSIASGLYSVTSATETDDTITATLTGAPYRRGGSFNDGKLCLVVYPADVKDGVRGLLRYDRAIREAVAAAPVGVEQRTVGRVTERYGAVSTLVATTAGTFPDELLAFLTPHRRLSWGM